MFQNVGIYNSDTGKSPRRKHTTFRTRQKFEIKNLGITFNGISLRMGEHLKIPCNGCTPSSCKSVLPFATLPASPSSTFNWQMFSNFSLLHDVRHPAHAQLFSGRKAGLPFHFNSWLTVSCLMKESQTESWSH